MYMIQLKSSYVFIPKLPTIHETYEDTLGTMRWPPCYYCYWNNSHLEDNLFPMKNIRVIFKQVKV